MSSTEDIVADVRDALRALNLPGAVIGLGGAHAKGLQDAFSDVDFYVFAGDWPQPPALVRHMGQALPKASGLRSWAGTGECGVDFCLFGQVVEIWFRQSAPVLAAAERALAGAVEREDRVWTPNGFFRFAALSDLTSMQVLDCASPDFEAALTRFRTYPEPLRQAVFAHGMQPLNFWRGNVHLETAIARVDLYYLQSILHQVRAGLIQSAFAADRKYFPGDKKMPQMLEQLDALPDGFVAAVLDFGCDGDSARWQARFDSLFAAGQALARQIDP